MASPLTTVVKTFFFFLSKGKGDIFANENFFCQVNSEVIKLIYINVYQDSQNAGGPSIWAHITNRSLKFSLYLQETPVKEL